jgi:hypothetical protein
VDHFRRYHLSIHLFIFHIQHAMSHQETTRVHAGNHHGGRSSYDAVPQDEAIITPDQFKESMRFVRLQIAIPISGMPAFHIFSDIQFGEAVSLMVWSMVANPTKS